MADAVLKQLRRQVPHIKFLSAADSVVCGQDLRASGNKRYGSNVYVATHTSPEVTEPPLTGEHIKAGHRERYGRRELRCDLSKGRLRVAVYDREGNMLTRVLSCKAKGRNEADLGELVWFGPVEEICTPWSDNDPSQCQVITVEVLRLWAKKGENGA